MSGRLIAFKWLSVPEAMLLVQRTIAFAALLRLGHTFDVPEYDILVMSQIGWSDGNYFSNIFQNAVIVTCIRQKIATMYDVALRQ